MTVTGIETAGSVWKPDLHWPWLTLTVYIEHRPSISGLTELLQGTFLPSLQNIPMNDTPKRMVIGSIAVAGLVALLALADLLVGVPFSGTEHTRLMDILFLVAAGIVIYLGINAYKDFA